MRFKQYLTEDFLPSIEYTINTLYRDCMPFIIDISKLPITQNMIYSGRKGNQYIIKKDVRKGRKPLDTPRYDHELFDDLLYDKFKIKGRSDTLFVTGDPSIASGYGNSVYMIFPIGSYKIIWSDMVSDLYNNHYINQIYNKYNISFKDVHDKHYDERLIKDLKKNIISTYYIGNIKKAINSGYEIMLSCKEYYGIKWNKYFYQVRSYVYRMGTDKPTADNFAEWVERYYKKDCSHADSGVSIFKQQNEL